MNLRIRLIPMSDSSASDIKFPLKKCWKIGSHIVVVIDKSLAEQLGLDEDNTIVQEELLDDGIFLRVIKTQFDAANIETDIQ